MECTPPHPTQLLLNPLKKLKGRQRQTNIYTHAHKIDNADNIIHTVHVCTCR